MSIRGRRTEVARSPVHEGCRDAASVVLAYVPFGLALGATLARSSVDPVIGWLSSPLLFGGAAQLLSVQLLGAGAGAAVVVLGALVVNARMLLYSASVAPHARAWPARWRWAGAYLLADPVYALAVGRFGRPDRGGDPHERLAYYLAVGITLWIGWLSLTGAGEMLAGVLPASLSLELAAPLTFLLLLLPMLTSGAAYAAAATGGVVAVLASGLPLGLGLLLGAAAGVTAGGLVGARRA
jgi:predicted branched-subunit amino acid permease